MPAIPMERRAGITALRCQPNFAFALRRSDRLFPEASRFEPTGQAVVRAVGMLYRGGLWMMLKRIRERRREEEVACWGALMRFLDPTSAVLEGTISVPGIARVKSDMQGWNGPLF